MGSQNWMRSPCKASAAPARQHEQGRAAAGPAQARQASWGVWTQGWIRRFQAASRERYLDPACRFLLQLYQHRLILKQQPAVPAARTHAHTQPEPLTAPS